METNNINNPTTQESTSEIKNNKQYKSFWPIIIIATLSALVGGLVVWSVNNTNLEQEALSLLPGSFYSKMHEEVQKEKISQDQTYGVLAEAGGNQKANWMIYKNQEYGFELSFPPTWQGYKVIKKEISSNFGPAGYAFLVPTKAENYSSISDQKGFAQIMILNIYNHDYWETLQKDSGPKPGFLGKDKNWVYGFYPWQDPPLDLISVNFELNKVISTFKLNK